MITRRLAVAFVLSICLLLAQTLGQWHGVVHGDLQPGGANSSSAASASVVHPAAHKALSFWNGLFSSHQDSSDCQAYDQLTHADAAPGFAAITLPLVLCAYLLSLFSGLATARWHAQFLARGPPSLR